MPRVIQARVLLNAVILAATLSFTAPGARAQDAMPPSPRQVAQPNAALVYWPAWVQIPSDVGEKLRAIDWAQVGTRTDVSALPAAYREAAAMPTLSSVAGELVFASKQPRCDFEIRYDDGFMAVLPHLSKMRDGNRLLRLAAHQELTKGNADAAAAYVAAMARGAGQLSGDGVLISSLVGFATANSACEEVAAVLASGTLTAAGRDELLASLKSLDTADPMRVRATLAFEGQVVPAYLERVYRGPKAGEEIAKLLGSFMSSEGEGHKVPDQIQKLDEIGLKAELTKVRKVYEQIYAAWNLDSDGASLKEIYQKVSSGAFGPLAQQLCPSLEKSFGSAQKFRSTLRATIASVEKYTPAAK